LGAYPASAAAAVTPAESFKKFRRLILEFFMLVIVVVLSKL
jgi:hypothetical protein